MVLVLVLLMFTGLVVAAVMKLARTSLDSTLTTSEQARLALDVDGALEAAVNITRRSDYDNNIGQSCSPLDLAGPNSGVTLQVVCRPIPGTGEAGRVTVGAANRAPAALLSLGDGAGGEAGINQAGAGLLVSGPVTSNSTVISSPGALTVTDGQVTARGTCTGAITSDPAPSCDTGVPVADPAFAEPVKYAQPDTGVTYRPVPTCPATAGQTVEFEPGYYDDAAALTNLMSTCTGRTFWFKPDAGGGVGNYYFDFRNGESPALPGDPIWRINDSGVRVVAGAPRGWDPAAATRQVPSIPGSCVSPTESATNGGVRFVFGGRSRIELTAGQMEICGQYHADRPPIALQGATTGLSADPSGPHPVWPTAFGTTGCPPGSTSFSNPSRATYVDTKRAQASVKKKKTACLDLSGYGQQVPAPGSTLVNATLVVSHRETGSVPQSIIAAITPNPARVGATSLPDVSVTASTSYRRDLFDLTSQLSDEIQEFGLQGVDIRYSVTAPDSANVTAYLDSAQLSLTWIPPGVRPLGTPLTTYATTGTHTAGVAYQTGAGSSGATDYQATGGKLSPGNCTSVTPYPGGGACAVLSATSDGVVFVPGTIYAPSAAVDVRSTGANRPVARWGVIARTLRLDLAAAAEYQGPLVMAAPTPLEVNYHVYECPEGTDCSAQPAPGGNWVLAGGALATYTDLIGSRAVTVDDWELLY